MRSVNRIKTRIENLEWSLIRLKTVFGIGFFSPMKNTIKEVENSIKELNWVLGKQEATK